MRTTTEAFALLCFASFVCRLFTANSLLDEDLPQHSSEAHLDELEDSGCALLQTKSSLIVSQYHAQQDLVFVHVPMNFGNSITEQVALGTGSKLSYNEVTAAGGKGWDYINSIALEDASFWGPMNPDLQVHSNWNGGELLSDTAQGCPMYYTPQQFWPADLAQKFFGDKTVFGLLRNPYDRVLAFLRSQVGGVIQGFAFDNRTCDFGAKVKMMFDGKASWPPALRCQLQPQAPFFEGKNRITLPLGLEDFPMNAQKLLEDHGYSSVHLDPNEMHHVAGCDNTWGMDLDAETKAILKNYYAKDFDLMCKVFGQCDTDHASCCKRVPGMCPLKAFDWHSDNSSYTEKL